jgi:hypothetical protein
MKNPVKDSSIMEHIKMLIEEDLQSKGELFWKKGSELLWDFL